MIGENYKGGKNCVMATLKDMLQTEWTKKMSDNLKNDL